MVETLIHEIGHAFQKALYGDRYLETYFQNSPLAEAGFDSTAQLFGGLIHSGFMNSPVICAASKLQGQKRILGGTEWSSR